MLSALKRNRMDRRVAELIGRVDECLEAFDKAAAFTGPSVFFHLEALRQRRLHSSVRKAVEDRALLVSVYATLTSWGMHRMGPVRAKLVAFDAFADGVRGQVERLAALEALRLEQLTDVEVIEVGADLWEAVLGVAVSTSESQLVAGTKALHHFLPDLLPPMDRRYTDGFFLGAEETFSSLAFQEDPVGSFKEIFPRMMQIARQCHGSFAKRIDDGLHTSHPKCVDNAIVGYVFLTRGAAAAKLLAG